MSSPLEKFVLENRESFDGDSPDPGIWEKIEERMNPERHKVKTIRPIPFKRWMMAAAAVVLVSLGSLLYFTMYQNKKPDTIAGKSQKPATIDNNLPKQDSSSNIAKSEPTVVTPVNPEQQNPATINNGDNRSSEIEGNKEMYYYAKLIELKHEELKTLEKDEPLLYRQFAGDVQKLDSVYHSLKTQLPNNSNREQVIEAMITNLQLQIGLLNKQLDIIKQIKHSKKSAYEKAYKSV
jgi:predicted negative regulator of RcsB-dependent stress response